MRYTIPTAAAAATNPTPTPNTLPTIVLVGAAPPVDVAVAVDVVRVPMPIVPVQIVWEELGDGRAVREIEGGEPVSLWGDGEEEGGRDGVDDERVAGVEEVVDEDGVVVEVVVVVVVVVDEIDDSLVEVGETEELGNEKIGKGSPASG